MKFNVYFVSLRVGVEGVLGGQHDAGDEDTEEDQVTKVWMVTQPVALTSKSEQRLLLVL